MWCFEFIEQSEASSDASSHANTRALIGSVIGVIVTVILMIAAIVLIVGLIVRRRGQSGTSGQLDNPGNMASSCYLSPAQWNFD